MSACSATILGCSGLELSFDEHAFFRASNPWGFILFARNIETPAQVLKLTSALREAVGHHAPIFIDQEGGRVARMRAPHWREWLPALEHMDQAGSNAIRSMWLRYRLIAHELHAVGIDGNCAPLGDIAESDTHPILKNRCYGRDPDLVAKAARAVADGLLSGGVLPVMKHMPGQGRAGLDSHVDLPQVTASRAELEAKDFFPFKALSDLPLGMTAHIIYKALDLVAPVTQSKAALRIIREEIGFDGLLMTDDISMEALSGSLAERTTLALKAGCDMILHCNGKIPEMDEVVTAAGQMSIEAQTRASSALKCRRSPETIDISALEDELVTLLAGDENV